MTADTLTRREHRSAARAAKTRVHWVVLVAVLVVLAAALVVHGYVTAADPRSGTAAEDTATDQVPAEVTDGGPVIDPRDGGVRTAAPAQRTVALTFDDGPDPRWTPEILRVLREHDATATFFAVGSAVADNPGLAREVVAGGNEIGVHTFTHLDLGAVPAWQQNLELVATQRAIAAATGVSATLFRPPYSSTNTAVTNDTWAAIDAAGADGYLSVLSTLDSKDWTAPGADAIVDASTPTGAAGSVILMHDGGGDRSQSVAALDQLLTQLDDRGYRVTSVGEAIGVEATNPSASWWDRVAGWATIAVVRTSDLVVTALTWALLFSGIVVLLRAVLVMGAAIRHVRRVRTPGPMLIPITEPVSVIVPAYNESAGIAAAVRSIAASDHPVEIIVVDDGSTDGTADIVERLGLPRVRVIRQQNQGKPAALNTGIRAAQHELIVMVDGDTVFEPDTVRLLVQPFADPKVGAVSGNTKVANRGGLLGRWQHIEYVVGFNLDRRLFDVAECMPTVPGAIGGFRRAALEGVGGVSSDTLAEDTDLTMALCRDGWRVVYEETARAWTEAPQSLDALWKQRYRWCYGTLQAMYKHRHAVRQRGAAGKLGRRGLGYLLVLQVLMPLLAPVVDVFALYGLIFLDPARIIALWAAFLLVQLLMAWFAFALDRESPRPLWSLPLQQFVYRQLMYLVVIQSVFTALAGTRLRWHRMERYGSLQQVG
ncbi:bifunctional polysaccharide deacetylase/glycosyltransferase family 2 protein [Microbacterium sp. LWS13-1.2]|uniref:Bifunctional polysaccharide deacetylase/glycosyltransferase family 2 protein n=1 Tax=Microbacterium sp. LWS13-1.2 TaxID=3135264 RepID=A0AAU6SEX2_9MICO